MGGGGGGESSRAEKMECEVEIIDWGEFERHYWPKRKLTMDPSVAPWDDTHSKRGNELYS